MTPVQFKLATLGLGILVLGGTGCPRSSHSPSETDRAICERIERCAPTQLSLYPGGDVEGCAEIHGCLLGPRSRDCADAISALGCDGGYHLGVANIPECRRAQGPEAERAREGEDCRMAGCDEGLWCAIGGDVPACEQRTCRRLAGEGESCARTPCESGELTCDLERDMCVRRGRAGETCSAVGCASPLVCIDDRCTDRLAAGQPCASSRECEDTCDDDGRCAEEVYATLGESCDALVCEAGLLCRDGRCRTFGDVGAPCRFGFVPETPELLGFSVANDCRLGLACVDGRCRSATCPDARSGEACSPGITRCGDGQYCGRDGRCEAIPAHELGERCDPDFPEDFGFGTCAGGYCDSHEARCVPYATEGDRCDGGLRCDPDLRCVEGRCRFPLAAGAPCETSIQCGSFASCDAELGVCACGW